MNVLAAVATGKARIRLNEDRLLPLDTVTRSIARGLYAAVKDLPILSPHGHTDPGWFAENRPFEDPARLFITPDHYIYRMLYSHGVALERLGIDPAVPANSREIWRLFCANYHLFRGTPSRLWLEHALVEVFGIDERPSAAGADQLYDRIAKALSRPEFAPRALFDRFRIEAIATTESPTDELRHHAKIRASGWAGRVITAFRPDPVVDPEYEGFAVNLERLSELTGRDCRDYRQYLDALRDRRRFFASMGATSTDHGHPTAATAILSEHEADRLFDLAARGEAKPAEAELFRAHMLTVMAEMSLEDGLVMQIHPGSFRNHNRHVFERFGRDKGADIPTRTDYVHALKPLLDRFGNEPDLTMILFTLDESAYARELAPLAGHYPCLKLGPAWWFHDSPEGMRRFREMTTETAGFYNTVGFNDDTRAFLSIPARHDVARRVDCAFLARLVAEHRLDEDEAHEVAADLAYHLAKRAYKL